LAVIIKVCDVIEAANGQSVTSLVDISTDGHDIGNLISKQRQPFIKMTIVQQFCLLIKKVFYPGT